MEIINASLSERIQRAKPVEFGSILGRSFDFFGKVWIQVIINSFGFTQVHLLLVRSPPEVQLYVGVGFGEKV